METINTNITTGWCGMLNNCPLFQIVCVSAFVIALFGAVMAAVGAYSAYHLGIEAGKIIEKENQLKGEEE